ncbi:MAG: ATPase [Hyphomicrobiales bacterium]|nr:ATPase [Hyphomicrobiales bacterium]
MAFSTRDLPAKLSQHMQRMLAEMAPEGAFARWDALADPPLWRVVEQRQGISLARAAFSRQVGDDLVSAGCLQLQRARKAGPRLVITAAGRARLARALAPPQIEPFQAQHALLHEATIAHDHGTGHVMVNSAESPMLWLHHRQDASGQPLISALEFAAGERFRADLTYAGTLPQITANWSSVARQAGFDAAPQTFTEARLAARQRLARAIGELDADMTGVMIDICGFLKGLGRIEQERGWPRRSARHVLKAALQRLVDHYGLAPKPARHAPLRHWGADDYRPLLRPPH